ncbi:MAG: FRG domain-containing protein, partial [Porticoccaceae bacterium]|nr:FRG domain-containing protein [Porticoccaceae bacterium]
MSEDSTVYQWQEIDTFKSLGQIIDMSLAAPQFRIYRGVTKLREINDDLIPKIGRCKDTYSISHEKELLVRFIRQSQPYITYTPTSKLEWMILAQHYSLSTRLLDWTTNLMVALFFACRGDSDAPGAVYEFLSSSIYDLTEDGPDPFQITELRVVKPNHLDKRIVAQQGLFTLHPTPTESPQWSGRKYIITPALKKEIKEKIARFGFKPSTMFPDLENLAHDIMDECNP